MVSNSGYSSFEASGNGLEYEDFKCMGDLAFEQLAELRHRGAFSIVSQTFEACCVQCAASKNPAVQRLPGLWYQVIHSLR
jgi:hypothetical protein